MKLRIPPLLIVVALIAIFVSAVVLPVAQVRSLDKGAASWAWGQWGCTALAFVAVIVIPWIRARPLRGLLKSTANMIPGSITFLAELSTGSAVVVAADDDGFEIRSPGRAPSRTPWSLIRSVDLVRPGGWSDLIVRITGPTDVDTVALTPLRPGGSRALPKDRVELLIGDLRRIAKIGL